MSLFVVLKRIDDREFAINHDGSVEETLFNASLMRESEADALALQVGGSAFPEDRIFGNDLDWESDESEF